MSSSEGKSLLATAWLKFQLSRCCLTACVISDKRTSQSAPPGRGQTEKLNLQPSGIVFSALGTHQIAYGHHVDFVRTDPVLPTGCRFECKPAADHLFDRLADQ